jgi:hypothetical protein
MSNLDAVNRTLKVLEDLGRIDKVDTAMVHALRSMAAALDLDPSNAALWGRYLATLGDLLEAEVDADSGLAEALAEIRSATEVGDSATS